jgi:glycosyltransferase involved in cell wall biosynthesis
MIASAIAQSTQAYRLIVSDNSSTDDVQEMVQREFPEVAYHRRLPSTSAGEHLRRMLHECETRYVALVHDDDLLAPTYAEKMLSAIARHPEAICYASNARVIDRQSESVRSRFYVSTAREDLVNDTEWLTRRWFSYASFSVAPFPSYVYDRERLGGLAPEQTEYGQYSDYVFIYNCLLKAPLVWVNEPLYLYRRHGAQDSSSITRRSYLKLVQFIRENEPLYAASAQFDLFRASHLKALADRLTRHKQARRLRVIQRSLLARRPTDVARRLVLGLS